MRTIKADLQNHFTTKSRILQPRTIADKVYDVLGRGGLCSLVNYGDKRYESFAKIAQDLPMVYNLGNAVYFQDRDILIIKGQEFSVAEGGDLLAVCLKEKTEIKSGKSLEYSLKEVLDNGGINIITTPFFRSNVGETIMQNLNLLNLVDAIEVHNGEAMLNGANKKAKQLYERIKNDYPHIGQLASSDGHSFDEVGSSYTELCMPEYQTLNSARSLREELRKSIRNARSNKNLHRINSPLGFALHAGIIVFMKLAEKIKIPINKGDKEALG